MLTYKQGVPEILQGVALNPYVTRYLPPFDEFEVDRCHLPQGEMVEFPRVPGPSIVVVTFGEGIIYTSYFTGDKILQREVLFGPADTEISITSSSELNTYRARVNNNTACSFMPHKFVFQNPAVHLSNLARQCNILTLSCAIVIRYKY
jgi:mannose-6-phosphate isomerase